MLFTSIRYGLREHPWRWLLRATLTIGAIFIVGALFWQGVTASGVPDPTAAHLDSAAVVTNTGLLVFREGLEAILVLTAITASFVGTQQRYRRPVAIGAGLALLASIVTWFVLVGLISAIDAPALAIQAVTGVLAIVVLLVIMNWFFHKIYWTGWIAHHNRRKRNIEAQVAAGTSGATTGLLLLGFSAVYREGFEIDLFLQNLRLQVGSGTVLSGVIIGLAATAVVGALTFFGQHKLPYKKMLVLTGLLLAMVLIVMVGESVQELQLAGWLSTTAVPLPIPGWMGIWFALFPNVEGIVAQIVAGIAVFGSYIAARYLRVWAPQRRSQAS